MIRTSLDAERKPKNSLALQFQKLKTEIHRQLIEGLDISSLNRIKPDRLRREVRALAVRLTNSSPEMLNELERERLLVEITYEAFRLGPLQSPIKTPEVRGI